MDEIRSPEQRFDSVKEVSAAAGIKIAAPNLENVIAGSPVVAVWEGKENAAEEVMQEIQSLKIESETLGPIVRTDALGSLEALTMLLEKAGMRPKSASVGEVSRKEIIEAASIAKEDKFKGVIFAFNTKLNQGAEEELKKTQVKVFSANIIYKLIEDYEKEFGFNIRYTVMAEEEFADRRYVMDKFLYALFEADHLKVINDLGI